MRAADLLRLPRATGVLRVGKWWVAVGPARDRVDTLADLAAAAHDLGWRDTPVEPPVAPLWVGWLTDDLSRGLVGLDPDDRRPAATPVAPMRFTLHDHAVWVREGRVAAAGDPESVRRLLEDRIDLHGAAEGRVSSTLDRDAHQGAVERIKDWIADGDVYQVNLARILSAGWTGDGRALAQRLWAASPDAGHAAWLSGDDVEVASVSPETFLHAEAGRLSVQPIKGTRRRGRDARADAAARAALLRSAKDRAEHVMIVDLERNDLGRVCDVGSVTVPEMLVLQENRAVWHLVSTVVGQARAGVGLDDVLAALFPSGSVTGAPKRMAVDRIARVEPVRRGVYCGAVGVIGRGLVDLSVAIRTAVLHDGTAHYGTGGGIVADSDPTAEWDETTAKAAPFLAALGH